MEPFKVHRGLLAPLSHANVDTDQIFPKQFLKTIARTGFGPVLFNDWRYLSNGSPDPRFSLNEPRFHGASILVTGNNFGCGSSREHAVWAVQQYGFKAVIAPWHSGQGARIPGFADIFRNNSYKNGLLPIELSEEEINKILRLIAENPGLEATVDLGKQTVTVHSATLSVFSFEIDPSHKERLFKGLDDIGITLEKESLIRSFEAKHNVQL